MPITFECTCGRKFRTADENAGRSTTCPDCRSKMIVPASAVGARTAPVGPPPIPVEQPPAQADAPYNFQSEEVVPVPQREDRPPYGPPRRGDPYGRNDDYGRRRPYYGRDDDIRNSIVRRPPPANPWMDGGIFKGLGMMALGVVITIAGLAVGFLVFVGPWLFIYGIVCLVRGIASGKA